MYLCLNNAQSIKAKIACTEHLSSTEICGGLTEITVLKGKEVKRENS